MLNLFPDHPQGGRLTRPLLYSTASRHRRQRCHARRPSQDRTSNFLSIHHGLRRDSLVVSLRNRPTSCGSVLKRQPYIPNRRCMPHTLPESWARHERQFARRIQHRLETSCCPARKSKSTSISYLTTLPHSLVGELTDDKITSPVISGPSENLQH